MSQTKNPNPMLYLISILSTLGAIISIWQTRLYFVTRSGMGDFHSFCNIGENFDCTAIEMSKYSELFAGLPLSSLAIAGYFLIAILAFMAVGSVVFSANIKKFLVALTGLCVLFSIGYAVIMIAIIGKLCLFCLTIDVINFVMFGAALKLPKSEPGASGVRFTHFASVGALALLASFLIAKGVDPQADVKKEDLNDLVQSVLTSPVVNVDYPADAPVVGDPNAKVTIVKFSDYECPACKMGATAIHPLFKRYPKDVKFIFVNYPLDQACNPNIPRKMHEFACEAAEAAICASNQGKFLDSYETLFEHQNDFAAGKIADLLGKVPGLDLAKLKECTKLPSTADKLRRDILAGGKDKMNIQSTPTFYVNGHKVEGGLPTNIWIDVIDSLLKK